jgi:hypothetical protein
MTKATGMGGSEEKREGTWRGEAGQAGRGPSAPQRRVYHHAHAISTAWNGRRP